MRPNPASEFLVVSNLSKSYGSNSVLDRVSLAVMPGEVHAIMGENGAGKSTLIKCISGVVVPNGGQILVGGVALKFGSVQASEDLGIAAIHQESTAFGQLSAVENVFVGNETRKYGLLDRRKMRQETIKLLDELGETFDVDMPVNELTLAQRQMVGIARAVSRNARLIIMDEPTASLSARESDALFRMVNILQSNGAAILYISHRLDEIFKLSSRVTVLRDGHVVSTKPTSELTRQELIQMMVGRELMADEVREHKVDNAHFLLEVANLTKRNVFTDININVAPGEIVGVAGLVGAGRSEVAAAIFGVDDYDSGSVLVSGRAIPQSSVRAAIRAGVALVPEDRQHQGLVLDQSVSTNLMLPKIAAKPLWSLRSKRNERNLTRELIENLTVKTAGSEIEAKTLSGGNQQKLVVGKWIAMDPRVLILDEPTRGVDVGAKAEIYRKIRELAEQGMATLLISSDMPEVLALSDRIYVMRQGRIAGELSSSESTEEKILAMALPLENEVVN